MTSLGITPASAAKALAAFQISCPSLLRRSDASGLTQPEDWSAACAAAARWPASQAEAFFQGYFETAEVGAGEAFATGYFEPQILGSRVRRSGYEVPVYAKPADLLEVNPLTGEKGRGRLENGDYVLYYDRAQIADGALAGRGLEIGWAADPIDLFFLHIQGSGRLLLPDGGVMRIGYAGQNGRDYVGIGRLMKERGLLGPGETSMQGIVAWLRAHPEEGRAIMRENKSYIFFRELTGPGPIGAMGHPVTPRATIAADPNFVPLGAPVFLAVDKPVASGLWVAQDTGGAIKGANRFDTFWGAGAEAKRIAGGMQANGDAYVLLPKGTVSRLNSDYAASRR
ncbi:murein transglycosylase A [Allosphingosinicella sp.]|uniref:murein transglycosylase A n=1 Tax=Allosphingosinicella sp. TaxID=2823234 RepID=UPI003D73D59C